MNKTPSNPLPKVKIKLDNRRIVNALLDSGAETSIITSTEAMAIWGSSLIPRLQPWTKNMLTVDDRRVEVMGSIGITVQIGKLDVQHTFVIMKSRSREVLLGYDFMKKHRLSIIESEYVSGPTKEDTIPLQENYQTKIYKIAAAEQVTLHPQQKLTPVKVKIENGANALNGVKIVMTTEDIEMGLGEDELICIPTLDIVINNEARILMHNSDYPCPIKIEKGEIIGTAWKYNEGNNNYAKVRKILEHLDKETKYYDGITLDDEIEPETIGLEDTTVLEVEDAIEEANIVDKTFASRIKEILLKHREAISTHPYDIGRYNPGKIKIKMDNLDPVYIKYRPTPPQLKDKARKILEQLERANIITPSYAPWAAQIRWVVKAAPDDHSRIPGQKAEQKEADKDLRMAIDYSHMKNKVARVQFPLIPVTKLIFSLRESRFISSIDLRKAFWQVEICDESKMIWAFEGQWRVS